MKLRLSLAARAGLLIVAGVGAVACGDDTETPPPGGTGGMVAGAPAGGAGPAGMGAGGMGAGAGGTPAAGGGLTCATANKTATPAMLHAAAAMALLPTATNKGCAFSSCHDSSSKKANLILTESPVDLRMQLVGKAACEVPAYQLVDTTGGDGALEKSWLWQKLVAPANKAGGDLVAKPEWGTAASGCGQSGGTGFGIRMPWSGTDSPLTPQSKLEAIRDWICAGAPGPM